MSAQNTPYQPWMRSLLNRMKELYGKPDAKTISEALPDGDFFQIKGAVDEVSDLPTSDNNVGDIYIVSEDGGEYIWVTSEDHPNGYWEQLGANITPESIGAEPEKLTVTVTESGGVYSADKTFSEIVAASTAKADIIVIHYGEKYHPVFVDNAYANFVYIEYYNADRAFKIQNLRVTSSGWTFSEGFSAILPWSDTDAGKSPVIDGNGFYSLVKLEAAPTVNTVSGTTPTITPAANTVYECGELTSLTVSSFPANGKFWIWFTSGSTATTVTGIDNFTPEANKVYKITVENGYATYDSWATS